MSTKWGLGRHSRGKGEATSWHVDKCQAYCLLCIKSNTSFLAHSNTSPWKLFMNKNEQSLSYISKSKLLNLILVKDM